MPRKKLRTASDIAAYLSGLIRKVEFSKIDGNTAEKIGFLTNVMLKVLETGDFERRLKILEESVHENLR